MRVVLVLLFVVCVSSRTTKEVESSETNQNYQPMLTAMIDNLKDGLDDMKDILNKMDLETCQEKRSRMETLDCGAAYHSSRGSISHPSRGYYTNNEDCIWIITAAAELTITFTSFNTESGNDYLRVRDGLSIGSRSLGDFTGSRVPSSVIASSNSAYLHFTSDGSFVDTGFQLDWNVPNCGATYHSSRGSISHPSSGAYTNNEDCIWIITAAADITITFTSFNTEFGIDYLRVRDGSSSGSRSLGDFTGSRVPSSVIASSNSAYLRFTSDESIVDTGFQLTWNVQ